MNFAGFFAKTGLNGPRMGPRTRPTCKEGSEEPVWSLVKGKALVRSKGDSEVWGATGKGGGVEAKVRKGDWLHKGGPHGYPENPLPGLPSEKWNRTGKPRSRFKFKIKISFIHFAFILWVLTHSHLGDINHRLPFTLGVWCWGNTLKGYFIFPIYCTIGPLSRPFSRQLFLTDRQF